MMDVSRMVIPGLTTLCAVGAVGVAVVVRTPVDSTASDLAERDSAPLPTDLVIEDITPTMEDVLATHLFAPERTATGENTSPDLIVKGVYVGTERNAVFSLKSKPTVNLRVWQGDEEAALGLVEADNDPRKPITDFLGEWQIKDITFDGVIVEHMITGEVELYAVDYVPLKHVKDSAQAGFGQGQVSEAVASTAKPPPSRPPTPAAKPAPSSGSIPGSHQAVANRVGAFMQRMTPAQRAAFMKSVHKVGSSKGASGSQEAGKNGGHSSRKPDPRSRR